MLLCVIFLNRWRLRRKVLVAAAPATCSADVQCSDYWHCLMTQESLARRWPEGPLRKLAAATVLSVASLSVVYT